MSRGLVTLRVTGTSSPHGRSGRKGSAAHPALNEGRDADLLSLALLVNAAAPAVLGYANYHVSRDERLGAYRHLADLATAGRVSVELERMPLDDVALAWERQRAGAPCKQILIPVKSQLMGVADRPRHA